MPESADGHVSKARAHSRRGRPRHHRNPRQARLPIQSWSKSSAEDSDTPASSPKAEKRERGKGPRRIVTGTKAGNDDVPKTRPASSGQSGKNRPDPNGKAREIRVKPVQKTTPVLPLAEFASQRGPRQLTALAGRAEPLHRLRRDLTHANLHGRVIRMDSGPESGVCR